MTTTLNYFKTLYQWFFPFTCLLCNFPSQRYADLCQLCINELPSLPQTCSRCANVFTLIQPDHSLVCGECLKNPPPFDNTFALFSYTHPITKLIMELKFQQKLVNAKVLGELLADAIQHTWYKTREIPDLVLPVPLHRHRLKERGFNQVIEISRPIVKKLKLTMDIKSCQRIKNTLAQAKLSGNARRTNLQNAFSISRDFSHCHIAVIDDVITTGHTMTEFCLALKKAGASKIDVWCCAKTQLKS